MSSRFLFSEEGMAVLREMGQRRHYRAGELLFEEGAATDYVILISTGKVKISSVSAAGYEAVLAVRSAGEIVGEFSALDGQPRSASVTALDEVDGVVVSGERFRAFLRSHPDAALTLLSYVVARLREADRRRVEFGAYAVAGRVARLLLELAGKYGSQAPDGSGTTITVALSQHDLAGATGSSREAVARVLRRLRESGAIRTERRRITILRPDVLRAAAESPADET
jgi:CRP/FNR family transcriptional regulator, cyclic AMP receptor protein